MISASGSQHQMLFVPDSLLLCFCYPKEPVECWATAQLGKKTTGTCSGTPQQIPGVCWSISEQGQCLPVGVTEHLLQGSPTRQMSWPHHSIYNYFMMHSQELRKVSLFKKGILVLTVSCPCYRTDIAVSLSNRWPGSHTANQVTHSEGISQMISYHVLNFSPPKVSYFKSLKAGLKKHADQVYQNSKDCN